MALRRLKSLFASLLIVVLLLGGITLLGSASRVSAAAALSSVGHVYTLDNNLTSPNSITVFNRAGDGTLTFAGATSIGGLGSISAFTTTAAGSQGSLILSRDRTRLFAVDAGSNQVSVVAVHDGHLSLLGVFSSGGTGPVSLTYQDGLLYVLNAANNQPEAANLAGFRVLANGTLVPIPGATKALSTAHPDPAEVLIDPTRQYLLVTEKATNLIDVFRIHSDGSLSNLTTFPSVGSLPFGFAFNRARSVEQFIVADGVAETDGTGALTAYLLADGSVRLINGPAPDHQIAPCWVVITNNGRFAYTSNADSHAISGYRIHEDGAISLLTPGGVTGATPADTFPLEEALSRDSRFLYVLDSRLLLLPPGQATLSGFRIAPNGSLTPVAGTTNIVLTVTAIGLAAD